MIIKNKNKISYIPLAMLFLGAYAVPAEATDVKVNVNYVSTDEKPANLKTDEIIIDGNKDVTLYYESNGKCTVTETKNSDVKNLPKTGVNSVDFSVLATTTGLAATTGALIYKNRKYSKQLLVLASLAGIGVSSLEALAKDFSLREATQLSIKTGQTIKFTPDLIDCYNYIGYTETQNNNHTNNLVSNSNNDNLNSSKIEIVKPNKNESITSKENVEKSTTETNKENSNSNNSSSTSSNNSNTNITTEESNNTTSNNEDSSSNNNSSTSSNNSNTNITTEESNSNESSEKPEISLNPPNNTTNESETITPESPKTQDYSTRPIGRKDLPRTNEDVETGKSWVFASYIDIENNTYIKDAIIVAENVEVGTPYVISEDNRPARITFNNEEYVFVSDNVPELKETTSGITEIEFRYKKENKDIKKITHGNVIINYTNPETGELVKTSTVIENEKIGTIYTITPKDIVVDGEVYEPVNREPISGTISEEENNVIIHYKKKPVIKRDVNVIYRDVKDNTLIKMEKVLEDKKVGTTYTLTPGEFELNGKVYEPVDSSPVTGTISENSNTITLMFREKSPAQTNKIEIAYIDRNENVIKKEVVLDNLKEGDNWSYKLTEFELNGETYTSRAPFNEVSGTVSKGVTTISVPYKNKAEQPARINIKYISEENVEIKTTDSSEMEIGNEFRVSAPRKITFNNESYELTQESNEQTGVAKEGDNDVIFSYRKSKVYSVKLVVKSPTGEKLKDIILAENKTLGERIPAIPWSSEWNEIVIGDTTYRVNNDSDISEFVITETSEDGVGKLIERTYSPVEKINVFFDVMSPTGKLVKRITIANNKNINSIIPETPWNSEWNEFVVDGKTYRARDTSSIPSFTLTRENSSIKRTYELVEDNSTTNNKIEPIDIKVYHATREDLDVLKVRDGKLYEDEMAHISVRKEPITFLKAMTPTDESRSNITVESVSDFVANNKRVVEGSYEKILYYSDSRDIPDRILNELKSLDVNSGINVDNNVEVYYEVSDNLYKRFYTDGEISETMPTGKLIIPRNMRDLAGPFNVESERGYENGQIQNYEPVYDEQDRIVGVAIVVNTQN